MFEKKKKKRGEPRYYLNLAIFLLMVLALVVVCILVMAFISPSANLESFYPAPPDRIEIRVSGKVVDENGDPVVARAGRYNTTIPPDARGSYGGAFTFSKPGGGQSRFSGAGYPEPYPTACFWGFVEVEGYPHFDYEYGIENVEFGALISITIVVSDAGITSTAEIAPSAIKPVLAPNPVIHPDCVETSGA